MMWGIRPGPLLFQNNADLVWGLISSKFIGNLLLVLMNIFLIPLFVSLLRIPYMILMGFIVIFASIGAFTVNSSLFDIWMMLGFGLLGYVMNKLQYPIVPLVLAMVLGHIAENSLRQALLISGGSSPTPCARSLRLSNRCPAAMPSPTPTRPWIISSPGDHRPPRSQGRCCTRKCASPPTLLPRRAAFSPTTV